MLGLANSVVWLQDVFGINPPFPPGSFLVTEQNDPFITEGGDNFIIE